MPVLDDNKLLSLSTGEKLPLMSHMRVIIFEENCAQYPPAAVSRLGMIYGALVDPPPAEEKIVKVDFLGDIRRFRFNIPKEHTRISRSFVDDLQRKVCTAYGWDSQVTFVMKYYDEEGDLCTLTNFTAIDALALQAKASGNVLKFVVIKN